MKRGEVWWAHLPQPMGSRPVVLVSRQRAIDVRAQVTLVHVTTRKRDLPTEVALGLEEGLPRPCVANADVIGTFSKSVLDRPLGRLQAAKMAALEAAIKFALGLSA